MTKYAIIQKPYHPRSFTIYIIYDANDNFLRAIDNFKKWMEYNPKNKYAIFNITSYDTRDEYEHITDIY